jgi:hypothetical protein
MFRRLASHLFLILAVIAITATLTWAYFYATQDKKATITTAKINLNATAGFPLTFCDMLPGESKSQEVEIKNTGSREADFYVQMIGLVDSVDTNFCIPNRVLNLTIQELTGSGGTVAKTWYNDSICKLYPHESDAVIAKIANDVPKDATMYYKITLKLDATASNSLQNGYNQDTVHLIAVQYNGLAPVPDPEQKYPHRPWPTADPHY